MTHPTSPGCVDPDVGIVRRDDATVLVGVDPAHRALVCGSVSQVSAAVGDLQVSARPSAGAGSPEHQDLHDRLGGAQLLRCGGPWRVPETTWVQVVGAGRVARAVHASLSVLGLGRCDRASTPPSTTPDLVVVASDHGRGTELSDDLQARGSAHLWAYLRDGRAVVGPLVSPGRSTCLRCVDLWLTEADPAWPRVLTQWEQDERPPLSRRGPHPATSLLSGLVCGQVSRWLLGEQRSCWGSSLEEQPDGTVERRLWPLHPDCGCAWSRPLCPAAHDPSRRGRS